MSWLRRQQYRSFVRGSIWLGPTVGLVGALAIFVILGEVDHYLGWRSPMSADGGRAVLGTLTSALLTFIVFVLSAMLVAVQLASAQLSPRIIARTLQDPGTKTSLGVFVFTFATTLGVLARIDDHVPLIATRLAIWSSLLCVCVFLYLVDRLAKSFRPISILTGVATEGAEVIKHVYPLDFDTSEVTEAPIALAPDLVLEHDGRSGVVLCFDVEGLTAAAQRAGCVIEVVPQVGDFVAPGDVLFRVFGKSDISPSWLRHSIALGSERTLDQDPAFAFRIIVDIGAKALSSAINDPTTGVLALDQVHRLLRMVGLRRLDTGCVRDAQGNLRLLYRTPDWEDFVTLGLTEIRQFGCDSIQVARRMRALLEHLMNVLPPDRVPRLQEELDLLTRSVERTFADDEDKRRALASDLQGLGGSAVPSRQE